jgi:hypothetical protein
LNALRQSDTFSFGAKSESGLAVTFNPLTGGNKNNGQICPELYLTAEWGQPSKD